MSVRSSLICDEVDKGADRFKFIRRSCALKAPGLLLAEGAPTVRLGKTFWRVGEVFFFTKTAIHRKRKVVKSI